MRHFFHWIRRELQANNLDVSVVQCSNFSRSINKITNIQSRIQGSPDELFEAVLREVVESPLLIYIPLRAVENSVKIMLFNGRNDPLLNEDVNCKMIKKTHRI